GMALYVTSYRQRSAVLEDASHIAWPTSPHEERTPTDRWEGRVSAIHEGGMPYGQKARIIHVSRTDVDAEEDVPMMPGLPTEGNVQSSSWKKEYSGRKLYLVAG